MLIRIVKMEFKPEDVNSFLDLFNSVKGQIRDFEGCSFLELLQDSENPNTFFTYNYWKDQEALDNYRQSDLFRRTWSQTKLLFSAKPEAWSLQKSVSLP